MNKKSVLICIFVKTPGFSDIKTRLRLPKEYREKIFTLSALSTAYEINLLHMNFSKLKATWHISESSKDAANYWPLFDKERWFTSNQLGSSLGNRLAFAYNHYLKSYEYVFMIAADSPLITNKDIEYGIESLTQADFFLGPATDGGFYMFGGKKKICNDLWQVTPYSSVDTFNTLKKELMNVGKLAIGKPIGDMDFISDINPTVNGLKKRKSLNVFTKELVQTLELVDTSLKDGSWENL